MRTFIPLLLSLFLASCGGGGDIDNELAFRVIHASPDSPPVNILVDGVALRSNVDYKAGTGFYFVTPRDYRFGIEAILPGDDVLVIDETVTLAAGNEITVLAIGKSATDDVEPLILSNPFEDIPDGNARVQVVHAAPDAPTVDVYLTSEGASLPASVPLDQVTYAEDPAPRKLVTPGSYVVRVTPAGDPDTVLFDSGPLGELGNRADLLFVLVENTGAGTAPISLVVNTGFASFELLDTATPAQIRVVNLSPDAPALDVIGTPGTTTFPEVPFSSADNLAGIAVDEANGRALVVDNRLAAVVAVDLLTGTRSILSDNTLPGTANPFRGPAGIALDPANGRALVTDKSEGALLAVDLQTGARSVLSGRGAPDDTNLLFAPLGVALDSANDRALVVSNRQPGVLAVDLQTGARTILSSNVTPDGTNPFGAPVGIAVDAANSRALVVDNVRDSVAAVDLQTGVRTVLSNNATPDTVNPFTSPVGIALDSANGRALVVDNRLAAAFAVNLQTGARTVLSNATTPGTADAFSGPAGIALDSANGRALVVDNRLGAVVAVDLQSGVRSILSPASAANGIAFLGNTGYVSVAPDNYSIRGEKTAAPNGTTPLFTTSAAVAAGQRATVFVDSLLATIIGQVSVDDSRPVFAAGKIRFLHAAPAGGTADIYVQPTGTGIADKEPTLQNLVSTSLTGHIGFVPANYTITFTKADTKEVLAAADVPATGATVFTVVLVDEVRVDQSSDGKPAAVLVLDDLAD